MNKAESKYTWKEIEIVRGLKKAYDYVEKLINENKHIGIVEFLSMNLLIDEYEEPSAGQWRETKVRIGGTDYTPPIYKPIEWHKHVENLITQPLQSLFDGAKLFATLAKLQCFTNGNKRTAICLCNALLIKNNLDLMHVKDHMKFTRKLVDYYEDGESKLVDFVNYVVESSKE
jgi:Fic family protein